MRPSTPTNTSLEKASKLVKSKKNQQLNRSSLKEPAPILIFTRHSISQESRRRVSAEAIEATFLYGSEIRRTGARFLILRGDDIERARMPELKRFEGTTLVLAEDIVLKTCYINRSAYARIKKLPKHRSKWDPPSGAPACALRAA